jgi:heme/copper-type cytochrome/quinol oxidase subunit 3
MALPALPAAAGPVPSLADAPPPPPSRPRVVLVGAALVSVAAGMLLLSLVGIYLARRADVINDGEAWIPDGAVLPIAQPSMVLFTMILSSITVLWASYALRNDDRSNAYLALAVTFVLGFAAANQATYLFGGLGMGVDTEAGLLVLVISSTWLVWLVAAMAFLALMAFRALSGQYRRIPDGVDAAAVLWIANTFMWSVLWIAIYITK